MYKFTTKIPYMEFRTRNSMEFRGITTELLLNSENSAEVKSLPHKIPYSVEFQKVTSVNTLY
jgi:hypothetical protein